MDAETYIRKGHNGIQTDSQSIVVLLDNPQSLKSTLHTTVQVVRALINEFSPTNIGDCHS